MIWDFISDFNRKKMKFGDKMRFRIRILNPSVHTGWQRCTMWDMRAQTVACFVTFYSTAAAAQIFWATNMQFNKNLAQDLAGEVGHRRHLLLSAAEQRKFATGSQLTVRLFRNKAHNTQTNKQTDEERQTEREFYISGARRDKQPLSKRLRFLWRGYKKFLVCCLSQ